MEYKTTVSVIIPVYNTEKYLAECLDSLLAQEMQDWEAILVDDGSTDSSGRICEEYVAKDPRFRVWHLSNSGAGAARNFALDQVTGEFCFFLDADDMLYEDSLSYLLSMQKKYKCDAVVGEYCRFENDTDLLQKNTVEEKLYPSHNAIVESVILDKQDMRLFEDRNKPQRVNYGFTSVLYRTDIVKRNSIHFLDISFGEDTFFAFHYLLVSNSVATSKRSIYLYRVNTSSASYRYHANYVAQTEKYKRAYETLFANYAGDYYDTLMKGLYAQCFLRCVTAIEREVFVETEKRSVPLICKNLRIISRWEPFQAQYSKGKRAIDFRTKLIVALTYYHMCGLLAFFAKLYSMYRRILKKLRIE